MKDRKTKAGMAKFKADNHAKILSSPLVKSGEGFTTADVSQFLSKSNGEYICMGICHGYLSELVDAGFITGRASKPGAKSGSRVYCRKPNNLLKRAWRIASNRDIGIVPPNRLGAPV